ncbi:choice-of-anchor M domain-containing protein [Amycolatopsis jiangsuensis]|uniref:Putative ABC transporter-associated repeat protein n=1 Tax=Amycolatopsis jiangsuensis TaxID=1181879 RepID=A0A840J7A0_9PSEU|nr:choice-of-anchor M domain-containing protein [Amycolatopsis jiangsuensis]MBB4689257.1 putative ABC transporter-associated repeat protein [Amycolatopsis jiangsuensis]
MTFRSTVDGGAVGGSRRRHPALLFAAVLLGLSGCPGGIAVAEEAGQPVEIRDGHLDIGPALDDGRWSIRLKDDSAGITTWRDPRDVVLRVSEAAKSTVPAGTGYEFLGAAGSTVYLLPQTQAPGVVWLGWNTRHPGLLAQPPESVSLSLRDIEGPGQLHVFLDYGAFRPPKTVWDSTGPVAELPVESNVHTHANWAFSTPGEYRTRFTANITPKAGPPVTVSATVRFLVGEATRPADRGNSATTWWAAGIGLVVIAAAGAALLRMRSRGATG